MIVEAVRSRLPAGSPEQTGKIPAKIRLFSYQRPADFSSLVPLKTQKRERDFMATGFMIGVGDKTSCGGRVLEGDSLVNMFGILRAREGDQVSCGKDGKVYRILGGIHYMTSSGKLVAGNLDSISGCPCRATLYPSKDVRYESDYSAAPGVRLAAPAVAESVGSRVYAANAQTPHSTVAPPVATGAGTGEEPGFHIVETNIPRHLLGARLLTSPSKAVLDKFNALNSGPYLVKAGSIIVLSDPNNHRCTREEAVLMSAAASANEVLERLSPEDANFMMKHREEIATFLSYSSTSVSAGTAMYAKYLQELAALLKKIETLHQDAFLRDGHLRSSAFFAERKILMAQLHSRLGLFTRNIAGFSEHQNLKAALGISTRSLVHHWTKVGAPGQIPGYATHLQGVATATKIIQAGGWIGVAVGAGASYSKVQAVCTAGESAACERIKFTETGGFIGGTLAGVIAATGISAEATTLCIGIGAATATAGGIACALVVVGGATYGLGLFGEKIGSATGDIIYRTTK
nr:PAAR domain-containing protein [Pseudomonas sp. MWU16-30317]